jgi:lipopolysaccharide export system permease protein
MRLYRYVLKKHVPPFVYSIAIILFISIVNYAVRIMGKIISKGLAPGIVLEIFLVNLGWMVALAVPMAALTSTLMAFGSMSADNEIVAVKASGIPLNRLLIPPLVTAMVLSTLLIFFNNLILPDANHRTASLMADISRKNPAAFIEPKVLIDDFGDYALYVEQIENETGTLHGIKVFTSDKKQGTTTTLADSGHITQTHHGTYLRLTMYHGQSHQLTTGETRQYIASAFEEQTVIIKNKSSEFQRRDRTHRGDREKSSADMYRDVRDFRQKKRSVMTSYNALVDSLKQQISRWEHTTDTLSSSCGEPPAADTGFAAWLAHSGIEKKALQRSVEKYRSRIRGMQKRSIRYDKKIAQYMVEIHKKFSIPAACIVFILIGAPMGIMARRGGIAVGASYSILFFILNWALLIHGEKLADNLIISPFLAMWSGNLLLGACGIFLVARMGHQRTVISFSWFFSIWRRLVQWIRTNPVMKTTATVVLAPIRLFFAFLMLFRRLTGTLPLYVLRLFLGYVVGITVAIIAVFVSVDYVSNSNIFDTAQLADVGRYYLYYMPWIIPMIFPVINLLASMAAVGKMSGRREIDAMRASGVSVKRAFVSLLVMGMVFTALMFYMRETWLPQANMKREVLKSQLRGDRNQRMRGTHNRRNFYYFATANSIYFFERFHGSRNSTTTMWAQYFNDDNEMRTSITADRAEYRDSTWYLYDATVRSFGAGQDSFARADTLQDTVLQASPVTMTSTISSPLERSYWELREYITRARRRGENIQKYLGELHFKLAFPFMNFIVVLLGVSLAARMGRKGGAVLFGVGIFLSFFYWMGARFILEFGKNGYISPVLGAWLGNSIFFCIGAWLYATVDR